MQIYNQYQFYQNVNCTKIVLLQISEYDFHTPFHLEYSKKMKNVNHKTNKKQYTSNKENFAPLTYAPSRKVSHNHHDSNEIQMQAKNCLYELSQDPINTLYLSTFNNIKRRQQDQKVKQPKKLSLKQNRKKGQFSPWAEDKIKNSLRIQEVSSNRENQEGYSKNFDDKRIYQKLQSKQVFVKKQSFYHLNKQPSQNFQCTKQMQKQNNDQKIESEVAKKFLKDFRRPKCKSTITRYPSQKSHTLGGNSNIGCHDQFQQGVANFNQCKRSNNLSVNQRTRQNSRMKISSHQKTQPIYHGNKNSNSQLKFINQTVLIYDNNEKIYPQFQDNSLQNNIYDHILKQMKSKKVLQDCDKNLQEMKRLQPYSKKYHNSVSVSKHNQNLDNIRVCIDFDRGRKASSSIQKNIYEFVQKLNPSFGKTIKKQIINAIQKQGIKGFFGKNRQNRHSSQIAANSSQFRQLIRLPKKSRPKLKKKPSLNQSQAIVSTYETTNPLTKLLYEKYIYTISKCNKGKIEKIC